MNLTMVDKTTSINGVGWISVKSKITEIQRVWINDFQCVIINYVTNTALQDFLERRTGLWIFMFLSLLALLTKN